jgi:RNA polymerase sigma-70 factor (ECF subfamily)
VTDFELLERWGRGESEAGGQLFERYFDALFRFFQNKVDQGVEDLVQQTLLGCVEGRARFRGDATFRTYLFQTARFQLYAYYRSRNRSVQLDFEAVSVVDLGTSPSSALTRKEDQRRLLDALRRIPLEYQVVLELRMWEDLSGAEMAQILDLPEPTLRSRLRIATERLRAQLLDFGEQAAPLGDPAGELQRWAELLRVTPDRADSRGD